jgi:uncharacterized membrane protein YccC
MNTLTTSAPTLEQHIVKALTDDTITSRDLGSLLTKTETAITTATNDAKVAEATALDPLASPDANKARATLGDARFKAERLRSLLPRLQTRYEEIADKEKYANWIIRYEALLPQHDALAEEIKTAYAEAVAKIESVEAFAGMG